MNTKWIVRCVASGLLVGGIMCAGPANAFERGLYSIEGTSDYYYIDANGGRHAVANPEVLRVKYFKDAPVVTTSFEKIKILPDGEQITETYGPDQIVTTVSTTSMNSGLYMVEGTADYYYVDTNGDRHSVQNPDALRVKYFKDSPLTTTTYEKIRVLPDGEKITETFGPEHVITRTKTTTTETTTK